MLPSLGQITGTRQNVPVSHLAGFILAEPFANTGAGCRRSRACVCFCSAIVLAPLLSVATREARRVLITEVYNGSFTFVSVRSFMQSQLDAEARSISMQERSR